MTVDGSSSDPFISFIDRQKISGDFFKVESSSEEESSSEVESFSEESVQDLDTWINFRNYNKIEEVKGMAKLLLQKNGISIKGDQPEKQLLRAFFQKVVVENRDKKIEIQQLLNQPLGKVKENPTRWNTLLDRIKIVANDNFFKIALFCCLNYFAGKPALNFFQRKIAPVVIPFIEKNVSIKMIPFLIKLYKREVSLYVTSVSLPFAILILSNVGSVIIAKKTYLNKSLQVLSSGLLGMQSMEQFFEGGLMFLTLSASTIFYSHFNTSSENLYEERLKQAKKNFVAAVMTPPAFTQT